MTFQNYSKTQMLAYSSIGLGLYFTLWIFPLNLIVVHLLTRAYARDKDNLLDSLKTESIIFTKSCISTSIKCIKKVKEYMAKDKGVSGDETDVDDEPSNDNNDAQSNSSEHEADIDEQSHSGEQEAGEDADVSDESNDTQPNNEEEKVPEENQEFDSGEEEDGEHDD